MAHTDPGVNITGMRGQLRPEWGVNLDRNNHLADLAARFEVHPNQISKWKREFLDHADRAFEGGSTSDSEPQVNIDSLYSQIGQLKVENDFLKKSLTKTGL